MPLAIVLHGILGNGRNWRGIARTLAERHPGWRFELPDLRNHAGSPPRPGPHTVAACADDLRVLCHAIGTPDLVIGHSFGGKVALAWAARHCDTGTRAVQVLDCPPGPSDPRSSEAIGVLSALADAPVPSPGREQVRAFLATRGLPQPVIAWLATSLVRTPEGWTWGYDVPGIRSMVADFCAVDLWSFVERPPPMRVRFLRAGRSDRWSDADLQRLQALEGDRSVTLDVLAAAGHWLQVDDPEGTMQWIAEDL